MDRQTLLFKYYAALAGFQERQSLYWYFISNFPKATDLGKMLDKSAGAERKVTREASDEYRTNDISPFDQRSSSSRERRDEAATPLGKKYDGFKYSCAPLKQTCETVMVFQKPYLTGSCLHDTLALEAGDKTVACGALDIGGNRVPINDNGGVWGASNATTNLLFCASKGRSEFRSERNENGRYPSQTFCDSAAAARLDEQSGVKKSGSVKEYVEAKRPNASSIDLSGREKHQAFDYGDTAGCSKILHHCDFENGEQDLMLYCPKVSGKERNAGLEGEAKQYSHDGRNKIIENPYQRNKSVAINNHPTLKPISLNERILKLFKTPNPQRICYPFAGSGSEIIGGHKAGFTDWTACELNPEYVEIAKARIKHWCGIDVEADYIVEPNEMVEVIQDSRTGQILVANGIVVKSETDEQKRSRLIDEELAGRKLTKEELAFLKL